MRSIEPADREDAANLAAQTGSNNAFVDKDARGREKIVIISGKIEARRRGGLSKFFWRGIQPRVTPMTWIKKTANAELLSVSSV